MRHGGTALTHTIPPGLPLGKQNMVENAFIAVGPLMPLGTLMAKP
jgi:hypothetical protein